MSAIGLNLNLELYRKSKFGKLQEPDKLLYACENKGGPEALLKLFGAGQSIIGGTDLGQITVPLIPSCSGSERSSDSLKSKETASQPLKELASPDTSSGAVTPAR